MKPTFKTPYFMRMSSCSFLAFTLAGSRPLLRPIICLLCKSGGILYEVPFLRRSQLAFSSLCPVAQRLKQRSCEYHFCNAIKTVMWETSTVTAQSYHCKDPKTVFARLAA